MKLRYVFAVLAIIILVSGCVGPGTNQTTNQTNPTGQTTGPAQNQTQTPPPQQNFAISLASAPTTATAGMPFTVSWSVSGSGATTTWTAVYYDTDSYPGTFDQSVNPPAGYANWTKDYLDITSSIPGTFSTTITPVNTTILYYRAYARINGNNYWTGEMRIVVLNATNTTGGTAGNGTNMTNATSQTRSFSIDADDYGFYTANTQTQLPAISVNTGDAVNVTFNVRQNAIYGGLDFRGCGYNIKKVTAGNTTMIMFRPDATCTINSYWPNTNNSRATLQINVANATTTGNVTGNTTAGNMTSSTTGGTTTGGGYTPTPSSGGGGGGGY